MITLPAPAKINLGLSILRRRSDGYHDLRSVFCPISLEDSLSLALTEDRGTILLECAGLPSPEGEANLAWKAASLFLAETGTNAGVRILLHKRIPSPGGLGGGSSDAAAVLRALAALTGSRAPLHDLGLGLGSDVPFFLGPGPALVEGRGERLTPVRLPRFHCVLVDSGETVPTPWAYRLWDEEGLTTPGSSCDDSPLKCAQWHEGKPFPVNLRNDFLPLLVRRLPGVEKAAEALSSLTDDWGLSGSGPVLYAVFPEPERAEEAAESLRERFTRVWVAK